MAVCFDEVVSTKFDHDRAVGDMMPLGDLGDRVTGGDVSNEIAPGDGGDVIDEDAGVGEPHRGGGVSDAEGLADRSDRAVRLPDLGELAIAGPLEASDVAAHPWSVGFDAQTAHRFVHRGDRHAEFGGDLGAGAGRVALTEPISVVELRGIRLCRLAASPTSTRVGTRWTTLADPEGNEFDVVQTGS